MDPTVCKGIQVKESRYFRFIFYLNFSTTLEKPKCNTIWQFRCQKPQETSLLELTCKDNKSEILCDDILSIVGQGISKTNLDTVSHKNIPCIHVHGKWDNNNKQNGVKIQVTNEGKLTNYCVKTKHRPNTSSKTKDINEVMMLFQHKTRMKRQQII